MTQLGLRLLEQTVNGELNTQKPSKLSFCSFSFGPIFSSSRDAGMERKPDCHSSCIHELRITENKDPQIITAPQVLVCVLTGHIKVTAKRFANQWDGHPLFSSPHWSWPEIFPI